MEVVAVKEEIPPSALTWLTARESYETMLRPLREAWISTMQQSSVPRPSRGTGIGEPDRIGDLRQAISGGEGRQGLVNEVASQVIRQLWPPLPGSLDQTSTDGGLVFVACSFDPGMDPVYEAVACAAASVGLRATRVKDLQGDYRLTDRILTLLRAARIVVADLSHDRPNVYFELGYARGLGKTVITILRTGTVPHFDVHDWTYLEYADSRPLEHQLRERFRFEVESAVPSPDPSESVNRNPVQTRTPGH
jgi:hypothetical protein